MRAHIRFRPAGWRGFLHFARRRGLAWFCLGLSLCLTLAACSSKSSSTAAASSSSSTTATGTISLVAGSVGLAGAQDGTAIASSRFSSPSAVTADSSGNLYVVDTGNSTLRMVSPSGIVTTLAGAAGATGSSDGQGGSARFNVPQGITIDSSNSNNSQVVLYVADTGNDTVRKVVVTLGSSGASAQVSTLAGSAGVIGASDGKGSAARFNQPYAVAVDGSGVVYVADTGNSIIRKIDSAGTVTTFAGSMLQTSVSTTAGSSTSSTVTSATNLINPGTITAAGIATSGTAAATVTTTTTYAANPGFQDGPEGTVVVSGSASYPQLNRPEGLAFGNGVLYVADTGNNAIRTVDSSGNLLTLDGGGVSAGTGTKDGNSGSFDTAAGIAPRFSGPTGLTLSSSGVLYVADTGNDLIRQIDSSGNVTTYAGELSAVVAEYFVTNVQTNMSQPVVNGQPTGTATVTSTTTATSNTFNPISLGPADSTPVTNGNIETYNQTTEEAGIVEGTSGISCDPAVYTYYVLTSVLSLSKDTTTNVVSTVGTPKLTTTCLNTLPVLGPLSSQPALTDNAETYTVATSSITNVFVTQPSAVPGGSDGYARTSSQGATAEFNAPAGIVMVGGTLYVADANNDTIRQVSSNGTSLLVKTVAGAPGKVGANDGIGGEALLYNPAGVVVYHDQNVAGKTYLFVADSANNTIRVVTTTTTATGTTSVVGTIAGTAGTAGWIDGTGTAAEFNTPMGIALDPSGATPVLYVADSNNDLIRQLVPSDAANLSGSWVVSTLAGDSSTLNSTPSTPSPGLVDSKDGANGVAKFYYPTGLAVHGGNLFVADTLNHAIREVTPAGVVTTIAGSYDPTTFVGTSGAIVGGNALSARFDEPRGIAVDAQGVIFITEAANDTVRELLKTNGVYYAYAVAGKAGTSGATDGEGGTTATNVAEFNAPSGIVVETTTTGDYLYVADTGNDTIRKVDLTNGAAALDNVSTVVGAAGKFGFQPGATPGYINQPVGLALDTTNPASPNLYISMGDALTEVADLP